MSKKIKPNKRRRICRFSGCTHILSMYNHETYCYIHQQLVLARQASPEAFVRR